MFQRCLVVSRHQLLQLQQADISTICKEVITVPELPTEPAKLKQEITKYNADIVIGSLPINIIQMLQNNNIIYITFNMESLGTYRTQEEVSKLISQYGEERVTVLTPNKPGELYRVMVYTGLKQIRITVEETIIISH
jgi:hypothetical protein